MQHGRLLGGMECVRVALVGAGGKMGLRTGDKLRGQPGFEVLAIEPGEAGQARLAERGVTARPAAEALAQADVAVLAVPDKIVADVAPSVVAGLRPGAMVFGLDPAAMYAGVVPVRADLAYFVAHPCHPPLFQPATTPEAQADFFGGVAAPQSVVCALAAGPEEAYARGEALAAAMFAPILRLHRITVEQMALLEPGVVESTTSVLILACREALDYAVANGVPAEAARDFVLGHLQVQLAVLFGFAPFPFSDGAYAAMNLARQSILRDDWMRPMTRPEVRRAVRLIVNRPE